MCLKIVKEEEKHKPENNTRRFLSHFSFRTLFSLSLAPLEVVLATPTRKNSPEFLFYKIRNLTKKKMMMMF